VNGGLPGKTVAHVMTGSSCRCFAFCFRLPWLLSLCAFPSSGNSRKLPACPLWKSEEVGRWTEKMGGWKSGRFRNRTEVDASLETSAKCRKPMAYLDTGHGDRETGKQGVQMEGGM